MGLEAPKDGVVDSLVSRLGQMDLDAVDQTVYDAIFRSLKAHLLS